MTDELRDALRLAYEMPASPAKLETLELLARKADQRNDVELGIRARAYLYNTANRISQPHHMLAAYTWIRGAFDRHRDRLDAGLVDTIVRMGAHVVHCLDGFPEISVAQIEALYDDQERLHLAHGLSLYMLREARVKTELHFGRLDLARAAYEALLATPVDEAWCAPCRINQRVWVLMSLGRDTDSIQHAAPLLDGSRKCDSVPDSTWGTLLVPLARRGDWERARAFHARAHKAALAHPHSVDYASEAATFAVIDRAYMKAKNALERALPHAATASKRSQLDLFTAMVVFLEAIGRTRAMVTLRVPPEIAAPPADGRHAIAELRAYFERAAREIAMLFDRRHGNTVQMTKLAEATSVLDLVPPSRALEDDR